MKLLQLSQFNEFAEIVNLGQRRCIKGINDSLCLYAAYPEISGTIENANRYYINECFLIIDSLCPPYYEPDKYYLELLNYAASKLIILIEEQIKKLSTDESKIGEIANLKAELTDSLDKVTMIFQIAADKTERPLYQEIWTIKAHEYSSKADGICGRLTLVYEQKMRVLYNAAANDCRIDFISEQFKERAAEYQRKLDNMKNPSNAPTFFVTDDSKVEDTSFLLRHRQPLTVPDP